MNNLTDLGYSEADKVEELAVELHKRIENETSNLLKQQLIALGADESDALFNCKKIVYPDDPLALAIYEYKGQKILGLRISENNMGIEFDVPNLTNPAAQEKKGEAQNAL